MISIRVIESIPVLSARQTVLFYHIFFAIVAIDHAYPSRHKDLSKKSDLGIRARVKSTLRDLGWDRKTTNRQVNEAFEFADDVALEFDVFGKLANGEVIPTVMRILRQLEDRDIKTVAALKRHVASGA